MTSKILAYELFLLSIVSLTLLYKGEVTLSVGYACFSYDGDSLPRLVEIADSRMYRSKTIFEEVKKYAMDDKGEKKV